MAFFDTTWYTNFGDGTTTGYYAVPQWTALTAYAAGQWVRQLAAPAVGSERCFVCIIAGTTLAAEPTWTVTRGAKTAEAAGPTWQECTGMPGPCADLTFSVIWVASTAYTLGEVIYDSVSGSLQILSTAGTSKAGAPPSWSATAGTTTADNTCTWTSLGATSNYTTAFQYPHARLANAFTATWGAAGNQFAVSSIHAETQAATLTLNSPGTAASPCQVYCLSSTTTFTSPTLATTATFTTTGTTALTIGSLTQTTYWYGASFSCGTGAGNTSLSFGSVNNATNLWEVFDTCIFSLGTTNTSARIAWSGGLDTAAKFVNCKFRFSSTSQFINFGVVGGSRFDIIGGSVADTGSAPTTAFNGGTYVVVRECDLSTITGNLYLNTSGGTVFQIVNCKLANGVTATSSTLGGLGWGSFAIQNSDSAATNYRYYFATYAGVAQSETTVIRTGGATNRTTPLSWNVATTANAKFLYPFQSEQLTAWNTLTVAVTLTAYLTTNTTLTNGDAWLEVEYLGSSATPVGTMQSTRPAPLAATTALTTDSASVWGGSITNKYTIATTFTPQMAGPIKVRLFQAKASVTVYWDLYLQIANANGDIKSTGRQFFVPEWGLINETAPSFVPGNLLGGADG